MVKFVKVMSTKAKQHDKLKAIFFAKNQEPAKIIIKRKRKENINY